MKTLATGAAALAAVLGLAGTAAAGDAQGRSWLWEAGVFTPVGAAAATPEAVSYNEELVPAGAPIVVTQRVGGDGMTVEVLVGGLVPGHTYGTHVHTGACGTEPTAAGPHYQHVAGQAEPGNEVWLDFTANAFGWGKATVRQDWVFREGGAASVVLHERATSHGHGEHPPGDAGGRVACFTVPFIGEGGS
ncbi:superoxide dismutase family protein [Streptomyces litchfieldiae]|uniref:Superoxide dismutase [Cu-Zn] n=1 Tax=Streptomyces litchfieldiae TaxID=3075543 RepID=A0ABU2N0K7_9ACTN|nr:superoxide dismutase family protein [Streptomyces sp. DSM 44938]MDT0346299.1 superoxide dismutase family protein [Streptomyces sp. DSM 44938]